MRSPFECSRVDYISPAGFIVWEFPTVYIAQKLRLGKYLGELILILDVDKNQNSVRREYHRMGRRATLPCVSELLSGLLRASLYSWCVDIRLSEFS
jgi:hypothetical protein